MTSYDTPSAANTEAASESLDALIDLHKQSVDTQRGFEKMAEKAEPAFGAVVQRFLALHTRHVARLDQMVREMGAVPDAEGSFMGTVNRAVISMRAMVDDIDADTMKQIRSGEDYVLTAFDRAIGASLPQGHDAALHEMRGELVSLLASPELPA
jgi:uncharacterized protein (TIGR02284 family)